MAMEVHAHREEEEVKEPVRPAVGGWNLRTHDFSRSQSRDLNSFYEIEYFSFYYCGQS